MNTQPSKNLYNEYSLVYPPLVNNELSSQTTAPSAEFLENFDKELDNGNGHGYDFNFQLDKVATQLNT
jgi:hypothetical protein